MFKIKSFFMLLLSFLLFHSLPARAQKKAELVSTRWVGKPIQVDGALNDWKDSLSLYNNNAKLYYAIANDEENLYVAIRNNSREGLSKILTGGISFSANIEGKKKNAPTVTFPVLDRTPGKNRNRNANQEIEEMQNQALSRIKEIRVEGFKEIIDGGISLYNTYGIKAAASFDANNNLVQEIAIPLSLLNLKAGSSDLVTYRIKINGLPTPAGKAQNQDNYRSNRGGMYGNQPYRSTPVNKAFSSIEFYIKSKLALKQ